MSADVGEENGEATNVISHTLLEQQLEDESGYVYYCMDCCVQYESIEEFVKCHQITDNEVIEENIENCTEESQWEAIDNDIEEYEILPELDRREDIEVLFDDNSIDEVLVAENAGHSAMQADENDFTQKNDEEMTVLEMEVDDSENKYYCYDCRTVFRDLKVAGEHDCPGIGNALEEEDPSKNVNLSDNVVDELIEYLCAYCEQKFIELSSLEEHQVTCAIYNNHITEQEENKKCQCDICGKIFGSIRALNSHGRIHKTKPKDDLNADNEDADSFTCQICNTKFANNKSLKLHVRIHQDRPMRRIQQALPKVAAQKYDRLNHFFCEICNKSFDQNLLAIHKNMHQNVEEHICQICNRQFKSKERFKIHQQLHSADNGAEKTVINSGPTDAAIRNAKKGVKSMHVANAKKTFPCQYCGHLFWRPHEKVRHEYVHTGEKPYPCEVCGKRFRIPYSLTLHLRTHTDIRPYVCSCCNKRFKSHSVYNHHMRTHLNDRDFKCDICDKSFRTSVQLYSHRNSHTKPFNCTICNRPFASLFAVNAHMKSHSKSKNYEDFKNICDICGAGYGAVRALQAHKKEKHSDALQSAFKSQQEETQSEEDKQYEADAAAMMILSTASEANDKEEQTLSGFVKNESLENLTVDNYYLGNETVSGYANI